MDPQVRFARAADAGALAALDAATWSTSVTPAPHPAADAPFFEVGRRAQDVLVAEVDGEVAGYVLLGRDVPLPCADHVLDLKGLAVSPHRQRLGIGRLLVDAALAEAARRGAVRVKSRVLRTNEASLRLHEAAGFVVEGVLRGEFVLDGVLVDDVLLARGVG